jgi:2-oxoglutarate ferredoxin oxidoreductase subunit beta
MEGPEMPIAMGVIRDTAKPTYDAEIERKIEEGKNAKIHCFDELMASVEQWDM